MRNSVTKFAFLFFLSVLIVACAGNKKAESSNEVLTPKIVGEEVSYSTDSTNLEGYLVLDENQSGKRPGILVVHEWWGHTPYMRKRAEMLAELGYVAIAVDMYGDGKVAEHPGDAQKFMRQTFSNMDEAKARFEKAIEVLQNHPDVDPDKIGAIGYCFGGSVILSMANAGYDLDAVAAFHAGVQLPIAPSDALTARVLVANGADDPFVPLRTVEAYKAAMDAVNANYEYVSYEGAVHGFTNPDADTLGVQFNMPLKYQKEADEDSWAKMTSLFQEVFK
ncbi:dienelactone hydrolase family protein [Roseivirga sp. E12]|uniref:dienelactone hydrolase family protein n=1 Tax=Roseivirga sp. E12 TaxID=2819237 RepID=UPI001ABC5B61|nr:dienelactone hydrolase family protein [Roseivirga sp. E12]MBO3697560.1 dienelactone hydrolase family protein [Roseivirga sp. E12]